MKEHGRMRRLWLHTEPHEIFEASCAARAWLAWIRSREVPDMSLFDPHPSLYTRSLSVCGYAPAGTQRLQRFDCIVIHILASPHGLSPIDQSCSRDLLGLCQSTLVPRSVPFGHPDVRPTLASVQ